MYFIVTLMCVWPFVFFIVMGNYFIRRIGMVISNEVNE